eukprot:gene8538-10123_t
MLKNLSRITKELKFLAETPGPGISVTPNDGNILELYASVTGPEDSPYVNGHFHLQLHLPDNYPFEPPKAQFITPIYHPNIDSEGRICLDTLKPQPQGSWSPSITINTLLLSIRLLLMHPNAEDGLVPDITELFKRDYAAYKRNAIQHTTLYALHVAEPTQQENTAPEPTTSGNMDSQEVTYSIPTNIAETLEHEGAVGEHSSGTALHAGETAVPDELEYEYVADGYTLIGCNLGSEGQILRLTIVDQLKNIEMQESVVVGAITNEETNPKRQRREL